MLLGRLAPLPATTGRDDTDRRRLQARAKQRIEPGMKSTGRWPTGMATTILKPTINEERFGRKPPLPY